MVAPTDLEKVAPLDSWWVVLTVSKTVHTKVHLLVTPMVAVMDTMKGRQLATKKV